jgi:hypothetical protein
MDVCLVTVACCQVEFSATGSLLVQWSPTECGVTEYDREASTVRRFGPLGAVDRRKKNCINKNAIWRVCFNFGTTQ